MPSMFQNLNATKKIKIAINARFLIEGKLEGIGTYTHEILKRLVKEMPEVEFHFLFDRPWSKEFIYADNVIPHQIGLPARHPFLWFLWFEFAVRKWLFKNKVDLFLSTDSFLSLSSPTKTLLVMHDLAFEHFPKHNPVLVRKYYRYFFPKYAQKAEALFAVSNFTKQDLMNTYYIDKEKITVTYCGVSDVYKPLSDLEKLEQQKEVSDGNPYFICIGSLNPRKNISKAVEAFNLFKKEDQRFRSKYKLLIVGAKGWKTEHLFKSIKNSPYQKDMILTGHLKSEKLAPYLGAAEALLFPSLFEGFGIPIVEAYQCEVPVVTSNLSSTKEIGSGAAILINPNNASEMNIAMQELVYNRFDMEQYKENIINKLEEYSWNKSVKKIKEKIQISTSN